MNAIKTLTAAAVVLGSIGATSVSHAGDCKQVKFSFSNSVNVANTAVQIKVKKIAASGNDGRWTENINNKKIAPGGSYTTNKRRLNKLDSGSRGTFTVHYDRRTVGPGWVSETQTFRNLMCRDGSTFRFELTNN